MKCPKCGYVSFDHNEICPKCKKGISSERDRMSLPTYKADPPFLLGTLIGEMEEPGVPSKPRPEEEIPSPQASEEEIREEGSEEFTIDPEDLAFEDYEADERQSEPSEADFIHLDDLIKAEPAVPLGEAQIKEDEIPLELEASDLNLQEGTGDLNLTSTSDQEELETLELDLELEESEKKSP